MGAPQRTPLMNQQTLNCWSAMQVYYIIVDSAISKTIINVNNPKTTFLKLRNLSNFQCQYA